MVLSDSEEATVEKYRSMAKFGVPLSAVQIKMSVEGITDDRLIVAVCGGDKAADAPADLFRGGAKEESASEDDASGAGSLLSAGEETLVVKYRSMVKAGVPAQAVQNKMEVEGLAPKLITVVVGEEKETTETRSNRHTSRRHVCSQRCGHEVVT